MKHQIRQNIKEKIKKIPPEKRQEYSLQITEKIIKKFGHLDKWHVYISLSNEVDTVPLIKHLQGAGKNIFFPVETQNFASQKIDIIIVPGRAFTQDGKRLGRGGGRYDKFLAHAKKTYHATVVIGICFPEQIINDIPQEPHDILMDKIIS